MTTQRTPLVLIAGTACTDEFWDPVIEQLHPGRDALAVTSVGHDPAGIASDILATARDHGFERFHLAGDSLGAVVAVQLAAAYPDAVESLLLINGWTHTDLRMRREFDWWESILADGPELFAQYLPLIAFGPNFWARQSAETISQTVRQIASVIPLLGNTRRQLAVDRTVDVRPVLGDVRAPTTVIAGRHDRVIPCAQARELVAGIAGARLWVLDTGHGAVIEDPAVVAESIDAHLDSLVGVR